MCLSICKVTTIDFKPIQTHSFTQKYSHTHIHTPDQISTTYTQQHILHTLTVFSLRDQHVSFYNFKHTTFSCEFCTPPGLLRFRNDNHPAKGSNALTGTAFPAFHFSLSINRLRFPTGTDHVAYSLDCFDHNTDDFISELSGYLWPRRRK